MEEGAGAGVEVEVVEGVGEEEMATGEVEDLQWLQCQTIRGANHKDLKIWISVWATLWHW